MYFRGYPSSPSTHFVRVQYSTYLPISPYRGITKLLRHVLMLPPLTERFTRAIGYAPSLSSSTALTLLLLLSVVVLFWVGGEFGSGSRLLQSLNCVSFSRNESYARARASWA